MKLLMSNMLYCMINAVLHFFVMYLCIMCSIGGLAVLLAICVRWKRAKSVSVLDIDIKLDEGAVMPIASTSGSVGYDLFVNRVEFIRFNAETGREQVKYSFGVSMAIPAGYGGFIFPRSSVRNYGLRLSNCVGVIDSDYRGEISAVCDIQGEKIYEVGDKAFQIVFLSVMQADFTLKNSLSVTERGSGGYGSTGR